MGDMIKGNGLEISLGNVINYSNDVKFGYCPDYDTGDNEVTVWDGADDAGANQMSYQYSTTADIDRLVSSNAGDTQDIEITGLDSDYNEVTQTITLTGQTAVALTTSLIRVYRMKNVGSTDISGNVYCYVDSSITSGVPDDSTKIRAIIANGNNQTEMSLRTVPAGYTMLITSIYASNAGASKSSNYIIKLKSRPFGQVFQLKHRTSIGDTQTYDKPFDDAPYVFTEKTDIEMTSQITETGVTGASTAAGFGYTLVKN